jgi:hypothetical protein
MTGNNRERRELSARVSALRESGIANNLASGHEATDFVQDSHTRVDNEIKLRSSYITPISAQGIIQSLSDSDRRVVELLATVQLASGAQIRRHVWGEGASAARQARRRMANLSDLRVVARHDQRVGGVRSGGEGYAYSLDIVGQIMTGVTIHRRRPRPVGLPFMAHALAVTDCYLDLQVMDVSGTVELVHFETEPECWRDFSGPGGARLTLKPDAFVITAQGDYEDRWFLEIDRSTESPAQLRKKAQTYCNYYRSGREQATNDVFPRVLWVVPDDARVSQLVATLGKLPAEDWKLFQTTTADRFRPLITSGAGDTPEDES